MKCFSVQVQQTPKEKKGLEHTERFIAFNSANRLMLRHYCVYFRVKMDKDLRQTTTIVNLNTPNRCAVVIGL